MIKGAFGNKPCLRRKEKEGKQTAWRHAGSNYGGAHSHSIIANSKGRRGELNVLSLRQINAIWPKLTMWQ